MKQIVVVHGGTSFSTHTAYLADLRGKVLDYQRLLYTPSWKEWLALTATDCDVLLPSMPNPQNAVFDEWKIVFEKLLPYLGDDVRLVGHSLGAMFLAKYLSLYPLDRPVRQLVLVAGGYDDDSDEDLGSFGVPMCARLSDSADEIHLFHSRDDPTVPFAELAKFQADLPSAIGHTFDDRGHFRDETFPELLDLLSYKNSS